MGVIVGPWTRQDSKDLDVEITRLRNGRRRAARLAGYLEGAAMPKLQEVMHVTKRGGEVIPVPRRPRDNWDQATIALHQFLLAKARKQDVETTLDDVPGYLWEGNMNYAVSGLWPELTGGERKSSQGYLVQKIKKARSARCEKEGHGLNVVSWWFIPKEFGALPPAESKRTTATTRSQKIKVDEETTRTLSTHKAKRDSYAIWYAIGFLGLNDLRSGDVMQWLDKHGIKKSRSSVRYILNKAVERKGPNPPAFQDGELAAKRAAGIAPEPTAEAVPAPVEKPEPVTPPTAQLEPTPEPLAPTGETIDLGPVETPDIHNDAVRDDLIAAMEEQMTPSANGQQPVREQKEEAAFIRDIAQRVQEGRHITPVSAGPETRETAASRLVDALVALNDSTTDTDSRTLALERENVALRETVAALKGMLSDAIRLI